MASKPRELPLVRASDIGLWAFCGRAWWLARVQGAPHRRPERLARGEQAHAAHGRQVGRADRTAALGRLLIAGGLILGGLLVLWWLIQSV
ncbi:MAG: hypothetical protein R3C14_53375 [Caldilineaceae bacterium]